jgi:hypothetical protein
MRIRRSKSTIELASHSGRRYVRFAPFVEYGSGQVHFSGASGTVNGNAYPGRNWMAGELRPSTRLDS